MSSRLQYAKKNIITGLLSKIVTMILPFITRMCIIQYLGSVYLGLNGLFTSVLQILSLAELGFGEAMVFSMYEPLAVHNNSKVCALLRLYRRIYRIIGLIVLCVGLGILPFLDHFIKDGYPHDINVQFLYIVYLGNTVISYWLFAYKTSLLAATQKMSITNTINTVTQIILSIVQIVLITICRNYYLYAVVIPLSTLVRGLITEYITRKLYPEFICKGKLEKNEIKDIEKRVAGLFIYKLCGTFRNSFDNIIISSFLGLLILAKYENYLYIVNSIIGIMTIISSSITAGVGNSIATESIEKNHEDFFNIFFVYEWIICWFTTCLFCCYQPFMKIWVGSEMLLDNSIVILICCYFFLLKTGDVCYVYRQAAGIWWKDRFRPIVEAITNLFLNVVLVKYFGVLGVQVATIITLVGVNLLWGGQVLFKAYFKEKIGKYFCEMVKYGLITTVCVGCSYLVCSFFVFSGWIQVGINLTVSTIIPNLIYYMLFRKSKEFGYCINVLRKVGLRSQ